MAFRASEKRPPRIIVIGRVRIQEMTMSRAIPQFTAERRRLTPTPIMAEVIVWVVLTGA